MALVIYDAGVRIHTPATTRLIPRGVEAMTEISHSRELPSSEDQALSPRATPEQLRITPEQQRYSNKARMAYQSTERLNRRTEDTPSKPATVSQIMTSPVFTIRLGATVRQALEQFRLHHVRHLAVIDAAGRCHGMVSEHELLKRSSRFNLAGPTRVDLTIEGAYPTQLIAATPDTSIQQVAITFLKRRLTSMAVLDEEGLLLGIITHTDLVHMVANEAARERWA